LDQGLDLKRQRGGWRGIGLISVQEKGKPAGKITKRLSMQLLERLAEKIPRMLLPMGGF
jgi:hypothetical protein